MNIHEAYNSLKEENATLDELLAAHKTFAAERGYLLSVAMREPSNDIEIEPKLWKLLSAEAAVEFKIKILFSQI